MLLKRGLVTEILRHGIGEIFPSERGTRTVAMMNPVFGNTKDHHVCEGNFFSASIPYAQFQ